MKNRNLTKVCSRCIAVFLPLVFLLVFSGCQKKYTEEELLPYHKEITAAWENGEYPGLMGFGIQINKVGEEIDMIIRMDVDIKNENAEETAMKLKKRYGDMVKIDIGDFYNVEVDGNTQPS